MSITEQTTNKDMIQRSFTVPIPIDRAFIILTEELGTWWPQEYTWAGDVLETIGMETRKGGRCFEKGPYGFTCDWGRILIWEPPERLVFTWQISPNGPSYRLALNSPQGWSYILDRYVEKASE